MLPSARKNFFEDKKDYDPLLLQLLYNRGLKKKEDIDHFLQADFDAGYDPFLLPFMKEAVNLTIKHIKQGTKICIYGDYDADGITSSALLFSLLGSIGAKAEVYIPDRVTEGYGLNKEAIKEVKDQGSGLIITVDSGIRNKQEVEYARDLGLDVLITDHHIPPEKKEDLPQCPIINPLLKESEYPFKYLAGVGVAFKFGQALISSSTLTDKQKEIFTERLLDLVAIGSISDCVTLLGENRVLVKKGMKVLNHTKRVGLQKLIEVAQINNKKLQAWNVGFQLGPRLNASSRMDHADKAFYLLVSQDRAEAGRMARDLDQKNIARQKDTEKIFDQAVKDQDENQNKIIVAVNDKKNAWSEGIIGLVASRITDKYYKPSLVITKVDDCYKGSGRSVDEFNIIEAVEKCSDVLDKYGGHAKACGFSLLDDNLDEFIKKITHLANQELKEVELVPTLKLDAELDLSQIDRQFFDKVDSLAPFGQDNPQPRFVSREVEVRDIVYMGKKGEHIKLRLNNLWAIYFNHQNKWQDLKVGDRIDVAYDVDLNEFNGRSEVQLKILDIKIPGNKKEN